MDTIKLYMLRLQEMSDFNDSLKSLNADVYLMANKNPLFNKKKIRQETIMARAGYTAGLSVPEGGAGE